MKICIDCHRELPETEFNRNKQTRDKLMKCCKSCLSVRNAENYRKKWFQYAVRLKRSYCKKHGIEFNLTEEYLRKIWTDTCPVFGVPFVRFDKTHCFSPALDRLDPSKGYVQGNVAFISSRANRIKYDATKEELLQVVRFIEGATTIPKGSTPKRVEAPDTER
jgi:hypothetical protein